MIKKFAIGVIILMVAIGGIYLFSSSQEQIKVPVSTTGLAAKLIESKGLAEFDPTNDVKNKISDVDVVRYKEIYAVLQLGGDLKDKTKVQNAVPALNGLIDKYPDYADLYVMRAIYSLVLGSNDYASISLDLDNALKYRPSNKYISSYSSDAPINLLKAKVDELSDDSKAEIDHLQAAVNNDPSDAISTDFFDTGRTKPEEGDYNPTSLTLSDFDTLVQKYPTDYRVYLLRGLYYASFSTFKEQYNAPAVTDIKKAITLNPQSAVSNYLLGELFMRMTFWTTAAASDISDITGSSGGYKDQMRTQALAAFNRAISTDSTYKYAYAGAAEMNRQLKNYSDAINDYSREVELDPLNAGAFNDKGIAETEIYQYTLAISDLTKAINLKIADLQSNTKDPISLYLDSSYQNRADANVKSGNYTDGISDYSKAIGIKFASCMFLMSVDQIRSIYPEFGGISDENLLEGLRQKYFPQMASVDFNSQMVKNKAYSSSVLSDLYSARGDAYLKSGDRARAVGEYTRAMHNDPTYYLTPEQQSVYGNVD